MRKIKFIGEEFFRSFKKSLFKNLLLMILFSIGLVMAVLMSSYYLDIGEKADLETGTDFDGEGRWYGIAYESAYEQNDPYETLDTSRGCWNIINFFDKIQNMEGHPFMALDWQQNMHMKESDIRKLFGAGDYRGVLDPDNPIFTAEWADGEICAQANVKAMQLDFRMYQFQGLKTEAGEGFTKENTVVDTAEDPVPVVVGNRYKDVLSVGQIITLCYPFDNVFQCRVAGILEQGAQLAGGGMETVPLDAYVLFPFGVQLRERKAEKKEVKKYACLALDALQDSVMLRMKDESEFRDVTEVLRYLGEECDMPVSVRPVGLSMGMELLRRESAASVRIMLILTIAVIIFMFYGLFVTFYDKIQSNSRVYGIYMMNGCSLWMILVPCLLEVAVILAPSLYVCRRVFTTRNLNIMANVEMIRRTGYYFAGFAFLAGAVFLVYLLRGVDTERLLRSRD